MMADRTLAVVRERNPAGWTFTLRVERLSSGQPGALFIIDTVTPQGREQSTCVVVEDAWSIVSPLTDWLNA
jgi:hypothetical protein